METEPPFFITGLPRSRTAWLSAVCSMAGAPCSHEGMAGFHSFEAYAGARPARGDSDPSLLAFVPSILERWPAARFVIVSRDDRSALGSFLAAVPEAQRAKAATAWEDSRRLLSVARDSLRHDERALLVDFEALAIPAEVARIIRHVGGVVPDPALLASWQRLRVTSSVRVDEVAPARPVLAPSARVAAADVCNVDGLTAETYERSDFETAAAWWSHHCGGSLSESCLPPLGVRVCIDGAPAAFLWCFECYGAPVAELAFPVTRPGLTVADARRALLYAVSVLIEAAGKGYEPEARFNTFKALAPSALARGLRSLGFRDMLKERTPLILTL